MTETCQGTCLACGYAAKRLTGHSHRHQIQIHLGAQCGGLFGSSWDAGLQLTELVEVAILKGLHMDHSSLRLIERIYSAGIKGQRI